MALDSTIQGWWASLNEHLAVSDGLVVTGASIKQTEHGFRVIIFAKRGGVGLVAFVHGDTWYSALNAAHMTWLHNKLIWRKDRYA